MISPKPNPNPAESVNSKNVLVSLKPAKRISSSAKKVVMRGTTTRITNKDQVVIKEINMLTTNIIKITRNPRDQNLTKPSKQGILFQAIANDKAVIRAPISQKTWYADKYHPSKL